MVAIGESFPGAAHAENRLRSDEMIWLTTVWADGQPQTSAVWFHWDGTDFLLVSQPTAGKLRNIAGPTNRLHGPDPCGSIDTPPVAEIFVAVLA